MTDSEQLKAILAEYPLLHDGGYGENRSGAKPTPESREYLATKVERFTAAKAWIAANLRPSKRSFPWSTSYELKHLAEPEIGYTSNGEFIAAMLACGYRMEKNPGYNPCFNIATKSVRAVEKRFYGLK